MPFLSQHISTSGIPRHPMPARGIPCPSPPERILDTWNSSCVGHGHGDPCGPMGLDGVRSANCKALCPLCSLCSLYPLCKFHSSFCNIVRVSIVNMWLRQLPRNIWKKSTKENKKRGPLSWWHSDFAARKNMGRQKRFEFRMRFAADSIFICTNTYTFVSTWFYMLGPPYRFQAIFGNAIILLQSNDGLVLRLVCSKCYIWKSPKTQIFPESVWAKGSSNSGGRSNIFTYSHLHIIFSSSSYLLIFASVHLHIFSSSHPHTFTPSHLHFCSSSHLLIFTSSQLHTFSSSHPHIRTSSHLHICSSSHLHICSSSHLHILSCPLHLLIFTSSHLHIFSSPHLHILTSSHSLLPPCSLALLLSCPLALSFFSISLLKARGSANETARNATLSHETRFDRQKLRKIAISGFPSQPFRTKWGSIAQNCGKIAICKASGRNPFARNEVRSPKTAVKLRFAKRPGATLSHEMRFDRQKLR